MSWNCLKCIITFAACFRYIPPMGLGIKPLAVVFASPVHTSATLFLVQALLIIPIIFFRILAVSIMFFASVKNFVILLATSSFMSLLDSISSAISSATDS
jgi:hypothetical protein